jgi:hypothetical protein
MDKSQTPENDNSNEKVINKNLFNIYISQKNIYQY